PMMRRVSGLAMVAVALGGMVRGAEPEAAAKRAELRAQLQAAASRHFDLLITPEGKVKSLKGKSADGMEAISLHLLFEITGKKEYRGAAVELADRILKDMRATRHGVLYIRDKERSTGETI